MRRLLLLAALAAAPLAARAQAPAQPKAELPAADTSDPQLPPGVKLPPGFKMPPPRAVAPDLATPGDNVKPELQAPFNISLDFFQAVSHRDLEAVVSNSRAPFSFEGRVAATPEELKKEWIRSLTELGRVPLVIYSVEVLPYEEMVKKYGKPPAKLADFNWKGVVVAVANLNGRASLALMRRDAQGLWRVYGFSD